MPGTGRLPCPEPHCARDHLELAAVAGGDEQDVGARDDSANVASKRSLERSRALRLCRKTCTATPAPSRRAARDFASLTVSAPTTTRAELRGPPTCAAIRFAGAFPWRTRACAASAATVAADGRSRARRRRPMTHSNGSYGTPREMRALCLFDPRRHRLCPRRGCPTMSLRPRPASLRAASIRCRRRPTARGSRVVGEQRRLGGPLGAPSRRPKDRGRPVLHHRARRPTASRWLGLLLEKQLAGTRCG